MDAIIKSALIGSAGSLIGGIVGSKNERAARRQQADQFNYQAMVDRERWDATMAYNKDRNEVQDRQWMAEHEFAKTNAFQGGSIDLLNKIQMAKNQGLHPSTVLGTSSAGYSPVGGSGSQGAPSSYQPGASSVPTGNNSMGHAVSEIGDRLAKAVDEKYGYESKKRRLDLERDQAEIELIKQRKHSVEQDLKTAYRQNPEAVENEERQTNGPPSNPLDPRQYYHDSGPYKGKYVVPMGNGLYTIDPSKMAPSEVLEAITGGLAGELGGIASMSGVKRITRPGGYKGPKAPGKPGEVRVIGNDVWKWQRSQNQWRKVKRSNM